MSHILDTARTALRKTYGEDFVPDGATQQVQLGFIPCGISTQSLVLDLCIGRPGIPCGRVTNILGLDGEGKSTLAMHILAECFRLGGIAGVQDSEAAHEDYRLYQLGVTAEMFENRQPLIPSNLEELYDMSFTFIKSIGKQMRGKPWMLLLDSMDGLHTEAQMDADTEDSLPMADARLNGVQFPRLCNYAGIYKCAIVAVSRLTTKMNQGFGAARWGQGEQLDTKGGKAIKFGSTLRFHVKKGKVEEDKSAMLTKVDIIKNKVAPPFQIAEYRLDFNNGIDKYYDLWEAGKKMKMISGGGGGRYIVHFKKDELRIYQKDWVQVVKDKGGPDRLRELMTKRAIRKGLIRPYGIQEIPLAECEAERSPEGDVT